MEAYKELETIFTKVYRFRHMTGLAFWDTQVMMPPKGAAARGAAVAELELHIHEIIASPKTASLLSAAQAGEAALQPLQRANLREMRMEYDRESLLPDELVTRKALLTTRSQAVWRQSRAANDFGQFLPVLKELVELARETGVALAGDSGRPPYEALFHLYEPGLSLHRVDEIFADIKTWLPDLIKQVMQRAAAEEPLEEPKGPFPIPAQRELSRYCMDVWKFDFDAGRQDISTHPFCGNVKEDVRVTTRYDAEQFEMSLMAVVHETGHAKYEQNLGPADMSTQPIARARSLGIHEGQSLFAERMIGRSANFAEFISPKLKELFGDQPGLAAENMRRYTQRVRPGLIRIAADELCYTMHVILRYEIERGLMDGTLRAEDVPDAWNEKMKAYLGLQTLGNDKDGCLQDIHWSMGSIGYFPTYSIGAMVAAQVMAAVRRELSDEVVDQCIRKGELGPLFEKQNEKIWRHGSTFETEELLTKATGEPLNPEYYRKHLERRYRDRAD